MGLELGLLVRSQPPVETGSVPRRHRWCGHSPQAPEWEGLTVQMQRMSGPLGTASRAPNLPVALALRPPTALSGCWAAHPAFLVFNISILNS